MKKIRLVLLSILLGAVLIIATHLASIILL